MTICGTIILEDPILFDCGIIRVKLLDVAFVDVPSIEIGHQTIAPSEDSPLAEIPFSFDIDESLIQAGRRYEIAAHLDLDNDGSISHGDFISMQTYPWHPQRDDPIRIKLRQVQ